MKVRSKIIFTVIAVIFIALFFVSSIAKNYIVKNSNDIIGRKIDIESIHINYLTVSISINNFKLYEENETDIFTSFDRLHINYSPWKLLRKEYSLSAFELHNPYVNVTKSDSTFNFDSLIPAEDSVETVTDTINEANSEIRFSLHNIKITSGNVIYNDLISNESIPLRNVHLEIPQIAWNGHDSNVGINFAVGDRGNVSIAGSLNNAESLFWVNIKSKDIDLSFIKGFITEQLNIGSLNGKLNSDINIIGNLDYVNDLTINGFSSVSDFSIFDNNDELAISFDSSGVVIDSININDMFVKASYIYNENLIINTHITKDTINLMYLLAPSLLASSADTNVVNYSADTIEATEPSFVIDSFKISNAKLQIYDESLLRDFKYNVNNINISSYDITSTAETIPVNLSLNFNNSGTLIGNIIANPSNPSDIKLNMELDSLSLLSFSPYTEKYIGFPLVQGFFNYDLEVTITDNSLINNNNILVQEIEFGKRVEAKPEIKVPVRAGLYILKDKEDNIKLNVPITGNTSDPEFKLGPIIWSTLSNLITKAATEPFTALASIVGTTPEELELLPFKYGQDSLMDTQIKTLDKIAEIINRKPQLIFSFAQHTNYSKEVEFIALEYLKKKFYSKEIASTISYSEYSNDPEFISFVKSKNPSESNNTIGKIALSIANKEEIENRVNEIIKKREVSVSDYLITSKNISTENIKLIVADLQNLPKDLQNPGFKIEVSVKD